MFYLLDGEFFSDLESVIESRDEFLVEYITNFVNEFIEKSKTEDLDFKTECSKRITSLGTAINIWIEGEE